MLLMGGLWACFSGLPVKSAKFWFFSVGIPALLWLVVASCREMFYLFGQAYANAWDRRREEAILKEVRRGRRALQILYGSFITAHSGPDNGFCYTLAEPLIQNQSAICAQISWQGASNIRHSRIIPPDISPDLFLSQIFADLLPALAIPLGRYSDNQPVALLFEAESSVSSQRVRELWRDAWQKSGIRQQPEYIEGHGLAAIDYWLDNRIRENTLLLVVALQIAPENPDGTAEAVTTLLLGNRLTQNVLAPCALMHRPEQGTANTLAENIAQAMDWGPVQPEEVHHLWRTGLSVTEQRAVTALNGLLPLQGVDMNRAQYDLDTSLGQAGRVAPWLAIAAAAQTAVKTQENQLIISGEQNGSAMWSTVITPYLSGRENIH
ncbi:hypothetical protein [Intestinirhabdus alba]|uniref:Uncharacterized protein n=1 Tax=Intestinirhabdus alba TaxID=2899544 RepID=A0A6L6IV60_9ENTR|nr:hypothetical protein [Intestinirhabdus alba]MTH48850.1 hypothetical protein [Intestinirhabdus alba]